MNTLTKKPIPEPELVTFDPDRKWERSHNFGYIDKTVGDFKGQPQLTNQLNFLVQGAAGTTQADLNEVAEVLRSAYEMKARLAEIDRVLENEYKLGTINPNDPTDFYFASGAEDRLRVAIRG